MLSPRRLNLAAIENLLKEAQAHLRCDGTRFDEARDPFIDPIYRNMIAGYALIDDYVNQGVDLFSLRDFAFMLEINSTVLCGTDPKRRMEYADHIAATEERFFDDEEGGIKDLLEWYDIHRSESVWKRAAGVYVEILSKPQLFIEGNQRTGSLIMSYLLMRESLPPFVLTAGNSRDYLNPSSTMRALHRHGALAFFRISRLRYRFAAFLQRQAMELEETLREG